MFKHLADTFVGTLDGTLLRVSESRATWYVENLHQGIGISYTPVGRIADRPPPHFLPDVFIPFAVCC